MARAEKHSNPDKKMAEPARPASSPPFRKRGARALSALVPDAIAPALRERGFASSAILTDWREIVGPHLAQWTSPVEIRWPRRNADGDGTKSTKNAAAGKAPPRPSRTRTEQASRATLIIACPGAFALDVQMSTPAIIEAVNRRLGFGCIGAIQIHQTPRAEPKPVKTSRKVDPALLEEVNATLSDIEHSELRAALAALGAEIAARGRK
jgi:hypothetical protein